MKRILLLIFFVSVLKAEAQENQVEISLSAGPIVSNIWKTTELGAGFKGGFGYKITESFTVLAGFEYFSLPLQPDNIRPYYRSDSLNIDKIDYINVEGKRANILAGNIGFKINIFANENLKPYLTAGLGLFSISKTTLDYDRNVDDLRSIGDVPPYQSFYGVGIDFLLKNDKALFLEITQNGFVSEEADLAFYTIPIRAGLKIWF